ncbi:hypothetical protein KXD40_007562 [Peronospora effusa]|uniref:Chromosome segregation in meiosis protein 3 domain-containing protein n=1 Tax=Peronospora effusa TaxID=542832 RepID=A0A3M6VR31_9STRA|nr:hypothetical protein DD238_003247 [Peronospora effusa]RQM09545.1 hypothetical protein DD237_007578 [Peronospora effusa]UIZ29150.1 hypothetical protein KXD40_007562 [Peronospora effusa]CAI5704088.1 unnamed protein product [Peronospora effusa]
MAARGWERDGDLARRDDTGASTTTADGISGTHDGEGDAAGSAVVQKRRRNLLRESHLVSAEGFKKVHRTFPYQVSGDVSGREAQALASLINMYKQWAFDLYPGLNFEDFIDRTEMLGKGHQVQGLMTELREEERLKRVKKRDEEDEKVIESEGEEAML